MDKNDMDFNLFAESLMEVLCIDFITIDAEFPSVVQAIIENYKNIEDDSLKCHILFESLIGTIYIVPWGWGDKFPHARMKQNFKEVAERKKLFDNFCFLPNSVETLETIQTVAFIDGAFIYSGEGVVLWEENNLIGGIPFIQCFHFLNKIKIGKCYQRVIIFPPH